MKKTNTVHRNTNYIKAMQLYNTTAGRYGDIVYIRKDEDGWHYLNTRTHEIYRASISMIRDANIFEILDQLDLSILDPFNDTEDAEMFPAL